MKTRVSASLKQILQSMVSLWGMLLIFSNTPAMGLEQLKMLAGTPLLDLRVDTVLEDCGLPSRIVDSVDVSLQRQVVHWVGVEMKLSSGEWEIMYSRRQEEARHANGWINPESVTSACLLNLSEIVFHTKGDTGILSVIKRADSKGYFTTYIVPDNLYAAHKVTGLTGTWKQGVSLSKIQDRYGDPDEILNGEGDIRHHRYWVVVKQGEMPSSVYAVDFEVNGMENSCGRYTVHTTGDDFVQEKLDALQRQWERDYVLD